MQKFLSPKLRVSEINELMNQFVRDVQEGSHSSRGWPNSCYGTSKLGVIALTRVMAKELAVIRLYVIYVCMYVICVSIANNKFFSLYIKEVGI